jgi:hypothetical protein
VDHYHTERNRQGIGNDLIERPLVHAQAVRFAAAGESAAFSITTTARQHEWPAHPRMGHLRVRALALYATVRHKPWPQISR